MKSSEAFYSGYKLAMTHTLALIAAAKIGHPAKEYLLNKHAMEYKTAIKKIRETES